MGVIVQGVLDLAHHPIKHHQSAFQLVENWKGTCPKHHPFKPTHTHQRHQRHVPCGSVSPHESNTKFRTPTPDVCRCRRPGRLCRLCHLSCSPRAPGAPRCYHLRRVDCGRRGPFAPRHRSDAKGESPMRKERGRTNTLAEGCKDVQVVLHRYNQWRFNISKNLGVSPLNGAGMGCGMCSLLCHCFQ